LALPIIHSLQEPLHREALPASDTVEELVSIIGKKFVAYIASENDGRIIDRWISAELSPLPKVNSRLELALKACRIILERFDETTVQAWIQGANPELDDKVVLVMLRLETDLDKLDHELTAAAKYFLEK
jgi:hypothetical protein